MSIATDLTRIQTAKADLKTAIEGKGVTVPSATKIDGYADLVDAIQTGGGGGVDLSGVAVPVAQNSVGGMFQSMIDGDWDSLELTVTNGTNPINIDFGRTIKGFICYPKSITVLSGLASAENNAFALCVFDDPDGNGVQTFLYNVARWKTNGGPQASVFNRMSSYTMTNGLLSLVPQYAGNEAFHPFGFGKPYIFVYWW